MGVKDGCKNSFQNMFNLGVVLILEVENVRKNSARNIIDKGLQDY